MDRPNKDSGYDSDGKPALHKIITSKAEAWIGKKKLSWSWKGNDQEAAEEKNKRFGWPWLNNDQPNNNDKGSQASPKKDSQEGENQKPTNNEVSGSWSSFNVNSTSSASSCGSSNSTVNRVDPESDCLDYEILWEDLTIGEHIGQGTQFSMETSGLF